MIELILAMIMGYFLGFFHRKGIDAKRREKLKNLLQELKRKKHAQKMIDF